MIAAEVLCYVADPAAVVAAVKPLLKTGGVFLASVEARYGWAMGPDVAEGSLDALLGDGIVHVDKDRWVRTFDEGDFRALLEDFEIFHFAPSHYVLSGPFEAALGEATIDEIRAHEARLRAHPVTAPLNRAWMAAARWCG